MKNLFMFFALLLSVSLFGQDPEEGTGYIMPGAEFTNNSNDTIVFMGLDRLERILTLKIRYDISRKKVSLLQDQVATLEQRKFVSDSAINLKKAESEFWHMKLMQNDALLEQQKIDNAKLMYENSQIRRSRIYYLLAGVVASSIVFIAIN